MPAAFALDLIETGRDFESLFEKGLVVGTIARGEKTCMYVCMYLCINMTYINTLTRPLCVHTYIHTYTHAEKYVNTLTHSHDLYAYMHIHTYIHTLKYSQTLHAAMPAFPALYVARNHMHAF